MLFLQKKNSKHQALYRCSKKTAGNENSLIPLENVYFVFSGFEKIYMLREWLIGEALNIYQYSVPSNSYPENLKKYPK